MKPEGVRDWVSKLKSLGTQVNYTEYPGVQHDSWVNAYADGFIFKWFDTIRRDPYPDRVRFVTEQYKYNKAWWVVLDELTPGIPASIEAQFSGNNRIDIKTSNLDGFTLMLSGHPRFESGKPLDLTIDGRKTAVPGSGSISLRRQQGRWVPGRSATSGLVKAKGLEGPLRDAFSTRHVYVYGTLDNPKPEVRTARMNAAVQAANWSIYRGEFLGRMMFFPRVISDREVRPSDSTANLVLFGTKETNGIIQKYSNQLPLHLDTAMTSTHGLLYVYPVEGRYVVVSSGLPWWTGMDQGFSFGPAAQSLLSGFRDYLLFQGSIKNNPVSGYFNRGWTLPPAAAAALRPAVTLTK